MELNSQPPEGLSPLAQQVLNLLEPDPEKRAQWIDRTPLYPVSESAAMNAFAARIEQAIRQKEKVFVAGDYDADGILSTAIMVSGLRSLGLEVGFYVPDRMKEGYGLSADTVAKAHAKGYSLIVTVDNGVRAEAALKKAAELGMDVIVTDHHTCETRPECKILIHPGVLEEEFRYLCGAGIAYECMRKLGAATNRHLMYAATASVGDCMQVKKETRAIIQAGLEQLNETQEPHLASLCKERVYDETSLGYQIVPRINAPGRLSNMANVNNIVRYFLSDNPADIRKIAAQIETINEQRKRLSEQTVAKCHSIIKPYKPVLVAADPSFHEGIVGLAAGNLSQTYQKPVIVCALTDSGYKCSMRAPEGFDCMEFLDGFPHYAALGGHKRAAGFTVPEASWPEFESFVQEKGKTMQWTPAEKPVLPIDPQSISADAIESLDVLRPFGEGFKCPQFSIDHPRIINFFDLSAGRHRKFTLEGGLQCLNFNQSSQDMAASPESIEKLLGSLSISRYQGRRQPSFLIDEIIYQ